MKLRQAILENSASTKAAHTGSLSYEMSALIVMDAAQAIRPELAALGAVGLERRLRRLQEEGLFE